MDLPLYKNFNNLGFFNNYMSEPIRSLASNYLLMILTQKNEYNKDEYFMMVYNIAGRKHESFILD